MKKNKCPLSGVNPLPTLAAGLKASMLTTWPAVTLTIGSLLSSLLYYLGYTKFSKLSVHKVIATSEICVYMKYTHLLLIGQFKPVQGQISHP